MKRLLLALALSAAPMPALADPPAVSTMAVPVPCVAGDVLLSGAAKLGERQLLHGDTGQGTTMVLSTNADTGKWTVLIVMPGAPGAVCIIATGEALTPGAIELPGEPS